MCNDLSNELEFTTAINTISVMAAQCLDDDELALVAAAVMQIGDTLATIAVQRDICSKKSCCKKNK